MLLIVIVAGGSQSIAATTLSDLAKDFVKKTNPVYVEKIKFNPIDQIPDGGTLLLKPQSQKLLFTDEIYAVKKNGRIYLAFDDVVNILNFPIDFDKKNQTAKGWFIREDWLFDADFGNQTVTSKDISYTIEPEILYDDNGLLFIEGMTLAKWLDLTFEYQINDQIINIESPFPLPSIARNLRRSKSDSEQFSRNQATLPRLEQEKKNFDINNVDVFLGTRYDKFQSGDTNIGNNANVIVEGEVLKHNGYLFASGNNDENLQNVVARLGKRSEEPKLLGALKARSYSVGDIDMVNLPLAGATGQDLGVRFDNNKLDNVDFAATDIEGDSIPDWDIELYRNDILISSQTVDQNGRYRFDNINLFIGDNEFELFFFGPQGEIRTEKLSIPVNQELLATQNDTYEVSVTFEDTQTLQTNSSGDEDRNTPHISARYNKLVTDNSLGFLGFRTRQIEGDRKFFATGGLSSTLGQTLVDTNFAVDEAGEFAAEALARRRIAKWDLSLSARANTDEYITSEALDPEVLRLGFNAQRFFSPLGFKTNFLASGLYQQNASGSELSDYRVGFSNNIRGTNISNQFTYELDNNGSTTANEERYRHIFSARKSWNKYFVRLGTGYEIAPDEQLTNITGQINYRHNNEFSADLTYEKQFITDLNTSRLNLNYTHDKFRLSPYFQYNSDDEIIAGLNLNFSLTDDPNSIFPDMDNRRYVNRGAVSALVYHDKDGNLIFDGDDEPLEDTIIESVNYARRVSTNADGYANIKDLTTNQATDIVVDADTLPDPFMIPATKGHSVFADAGSLYEMEFPVHLTGEVEGYVYIIDEEGQKTPASFQRLVLTSIDGAKTDPISVNAERDGYYVMFNIPPGKYILNTANKNNRYGNDIPQQVTIGYDGTVLKDINFNISNSGSYVPYEVVHDENLDGLKTPLLLIQDSGESSLTKTLSQLIKAKSNYDPYDGLIKLDSYDRKTGNNYYSTNTPELEASHEKCQEIISNNIACVVIISSL